MSSIRNALILLLAVTAGAGTAVAEEVSIGYIDLQVLVEKSKKASKLAKAFEAEVKKEKERLEKEGERLQKLQSAFERDKTVMSKEQVAAKEKELMLEIKIFQQDRLKTQMNIEKDRLDMNKNMLAQVKKYVEELAKDKELTAVYEKAESGLVYIDPKLDLTAKIVERLDSEP